MTIKGDNMDQAIYGRARRRHPRLIDRLEKINRNTTTLYL